MCQDSKSDNSILENNKKDIALVLLVICHPTESK